MKQRFVALSFLTVLFFGCSFSYNNISDGQISDVSKDMSFYSITRMPFMGGSMLYNAKNPAEGQLRNGVVVAVRQGYAYIKNNDMSNPVFSDKEENAVYGYLKIQEISDSHVHFYFYSYQNDSSNAVCREFTLYVGSEIDLNNDGYVDLRYKKSDFKRQGLSNSYTLDFISSQEYLNTNMFSVITEQYARNTYPMGLIGINTDGKFIVSVYENNSSNRSVILGARYGDYAFDSSDNSYKKILTKKSFKFARTIAEDELEVVDNPSLATFYFTESQFESYGFVSAELLSLICIDEYQDSKSSDYIDELNSLLEQKTLINQLVEKYNLILPSEIKELNIDSFTQDELVSLNRFFLSEYFPKYCPPVDFSNNDVSDVFPLLSLLLPKDDITEDIISRASTYSDYASEKKKIENEMNSYTKFDFLNYYETEKQLKLVAKIGLYGKYSITWSNVEGSITAICFVQAETELNLNKTTSGSLLGKPIDFMNLTKDIMIGYIPLSIGLTGRFDLNYKIEASLSVDTNIFAGYTGMYGGKITVGANYGTRWEKWFKIWRTWFYKPKIYIDPYAKGEIINKTAYFIGFKDNTAAFFNVRGTLSASITPNVSIIPKVGLCHNAVWMGVSAENGVVLGLVASADLKKYSGNAYVDLYLKLNGKGGVNLTIPFINKGLKKEFNVFSVTPVDCRVATWNVF